MKRIIFIAVVLVSAVLCGCTEQKNEIVTLTPVPTEQRSYEYTVDPYVPYTYEMMKEDTAQLEEMYDEHISVSSIGSSVEGRDITLITMGTGETKLLLVGAHHAREYISATYLMNMIDKYMYAAVTYGIFSGYDIAGLLEEVTVYIVPMLNPDGVNLVINGKDSVQDVEAVMSMAMLKDTYAEWKANINGVDLNRQYPCYWEVKASSTFVPSSEMYKGEESATEPEVQAMMKLCQNNDFALAASFHTKGEIIYWADSGTVDIVDGAEQITDALCASTGYEKMPVSEDPSTYAAGFENWFRQDFERPGFCIELTPVDGTSLPHDDADFDALVWQKAKNIGVILMESVQETES